MMEILHLVNEMSPYLLLGFLFAGILHVIIPSNYYHKFLSKPNFRSVVNAAILGIPLPLCSCGVIPTAMSLKKEGASNGATTSFLIATPQTGIDSILATFGLMGAPFAIVRPIAALVTALCGGSVANLFDKRSNNSESKNENNRCCNTDNDNKTNKLYRIFHYAFVEMLSNIGKWLIIGIVIAGVITIAVPDEIFVYFKDNTFTSMLLVLCISIPMYLCATGSIPIAVALIAKGLTPGAGLVLLMAGPACNMASILVVKKVLGTKSLLIYIASIVFGAIGFGYLIDFLHFGGFVDFTSGNQIQNMHACCVQQDSWFAWSCTIILFMLLINALIVPRISHKKNDKNLNIMNAKTYYVEGMSCNHCRLSAEKALQEVKGVTSAKVILETKEAIIEGDASEEDLREAVESIGFSLRTK
ncbi:MAG: permease [Bacteroidales bacterium]|nr:permease [Bacteroidales bacterium]